MDRELSLIAKGAGLYFAGFAVSKALAYLYTAMIARWLGPGEFGVFSIGVVVTGIILVFAALGLYSGVLHFVAVYDSTGKGERVRGTIMLGLKAQLVSSVIFAIGLFVFSDWLAVSFFREAQLGAVFRILALSVPFSVLTSCLLVIVLAFKKLKYKIYVRNFAELIAKISFTGFFLFAGLGVVGATAGLAASSVFAFVLSLYFVQKKVFPVLGRGLKSVYNARELFSYSGPLLAVGFFDVIMYSIDTIMLGSLAKAYDAGLYNVAHPTANLLGIALFAFGSLFLPIITGFYAQKKISEAGRVFKVVSRWIFAVVFPCFLFTVLFSSEILSIMFGSEYAVGSSALIVLSAGIFTVSFIGLTRSVLESTKRTRLIFVNTVVSGIANVLLNVWLIPLFAASGNAIIGAALATSCSYFIWNVLAFAEVLFLEGIHPFERAYNAPTIASCISIALFFFAKQAMPSLPGLAFPVDFLALAAIGITFLIVYGALFIVMRGLKQEDLDVLRAVENKSGIRVEPLRNFIRRFSR